MFKFLKDKLKGTLDKINKKVEEEVPDENVEIMEEIVDKKSSKKIDDSKEVDKKSSKKIDIEEIEEVKTKGLFGKIKQTITTKKISDGKFEELFTELEFTLLENNVALEVIDKIKSDLKDEIVNKPIKRAEFSTKIIESLKQSIEDLFNIENIDLIDAIKKKKNKPYVVCFVGVNGSGKTTTVAKLAYKLKKEGLSVLLVAGDTWRAASIQQLEEHGKNLDIRVIKHNYGSDPAAVAFDGVDAAKKNNIDVVLIDTAGRQHSNKDLMREVEKIIRVAKPDFNIFVGESITGNDCVLQAQQFKEFVDFGGIVLTKSDVDEKGGAAISISYVTGKPVLFLGKGQKYEDLEKFDAKMVIESLGI
jgi:fused signal recognition particle receptor